MSNVAPAVVGYIVVPAQRKRTMVPILRAGLATEKANNMISSNKISTVHLWVTRSPTTR